MEISITVNGQEFTIPDDGGLVTFFTTFARGTGERMAQAQDPAIIHSLRQTQRVVDEIQTAYEQQ